MTAGVPTDLATGQPTGVATGQPAATGQSTGLPAGLDEAFRDHQRLLWGLCYRMTGCAADADDLVQETFQRALERPPRDLDRPWRPWLLRVAMNLGRDRLRQRRRRAYTGPWLPSPIEPPAYEVALEDGAASTEGRYDLLESVSFAFLLALEQLTPQKRAVLLLCDVFDYAARETAEALGMTEANVRTTLHRARKQMAAYDRSVQATARPAQAGAPVGSEGGARGDAATETRRMLAQLFDTLATGDVEALERLLADEARALSDGGGEFLAALNPIKGPARIARFLLGITRMRFPARLEIRTFNGLPAIVGEFDDSPPRMAARFVMRIDLASDGRIREIHQVLATRKLTAVAPMM